MLKQNIDSNMKAVTPNKVISISLFLSSVAVFILLSMNK
jgi:hypothetical protein